MLSLNNCFLISTFILCIGIFGILYRRKFVHKLISSSLISLSAIINFISFAYFLYPENISGLVITIFIIGLMMMQFSVGFFIYYFVQKEEKDMEIELEDTFLRLKKRLMNFFRRK